MVKFKDYTILIVEDDELVRESFAGCLRMLFKQVYTAPDGESGLQEWSRHSPDIVVTDIYLPKMNGIELVKLIREQDLKIPILFMSSHSDPQTFIKTVPVSADGYIIKPFTFESCLENLQKCVKKLEQKTSNISLKGGTFVDISAKTVVRQNEIYTLTPQEFKLMSLFLKASDRTLHQNTISNELWGSEPKSSSALKNLLLKMRKKIGTEAIDTLIGHGYRLNTI